MRRLKPKANIERIGVTSKCPVKLASGLNFLIKLIVIVDFKPKIPTEGLVAL